MPGLRPRHEGRNLTLDLSTFVLVFFMFFFLGAARLYQVMRCSFRQQYEMAPFPISIGMPR